MKSNVAHTIPGVQKKNIHAWKVQVFNQNQKRLIYIYDFWDSWEHSVLFEKFVDENIERPYCLEARNACPPEDSGGLGGYAAMIEAFKEPGNPEKESYREWLGLNPGEEWDETHCSVREINKRLCLLE